jgi:hypothetical protein
MTREEVKQFTELQTLSPEDCDALARSALAVAGP